MTLRGNDEKRRALIARFERELSEKAQIDTEAAARRRTLIGRELVELYKADARRNDRLQLDGIPQAATKALGESSTALQRVSAFLGGGSGLAIPEN